MNDDFRIADKLAHAYGWSIEYISSLSVSEITGLLEAINERENTERQLLSYIILLAVNGKSIDSLVQQQPEEHEIIQPTKEEINEVENTQTKETETNIMKLFQSGIVDKVTQPKE